MANSDTTEALHPGEPAASASPLGLEKALWAYAKMMNTLDVGHLAPLLAPDFHYASQWVFAEISTSADYLDYITPKLRTIRDSGTYVRAEMGYLEHGFPGPCVVLAQGGPQALVAVILAQVRGKQIARIDMCGTPSPYSVARTGIYPGIA